MEGLQFPDGDIHLGSMPLWICNLCLAPAFFFFFTVSTKSFHKIKAKPSQNVTQEKRTQLG